MRGSEAGVVQTCQPTGAAPWYSPEKVCHEKSRLEQNIGAPLAERQLERLDLLRAQVRWQIDPDVSGFIFVPLEGDFDPGI
jgi:hypothetical protein